VSPLLTLENVSMRYAMRGGGNTVEHTVFDNISLEVPPGERLGIIGRNGAGKSTLLRLMAKIFVPTSGLVTWAPGATVSLLSLGLGFRPDLTGRENALLSCLLQGLSKADANNSLGGIEDFAELGGFFDQPVKTYSTGMRARLGFATALMNRSDVILIDEVLSVGDQTFGLKATAVLNDQMAKDRGVVIVSHAERQIRNLCNSAVWLEKNAVAASGAPDEVLQQYHEAVSA
jgi:lipopolysaccharide transport system ATP-binding protein